MNSNNSDSTAIKRRRENLLSSDSEKEKEEFDELVFHFRVMNEIKEIFKKRGWNKKRLAKELNTSQSFVSQLFSGNKFINAKLISRIERLLNIRFVIKAEEIQNTNNAKMSQVQIENKCQDISIPIV